jgi:hypothetical protein
MSLKLNGITVNEVGVQGVDTARTFTLFAEKNSDLFAGIPGSTETGLAVFNTGADTSLQFELFSGGQIQYTGQTILPAQSHTAVYLRQLPGLENIPDNFQGVLRITSTASEVSMVGIRSSWNNRGELLFSAVPAVNEDLIHPNATYVFPHFAFGSGYSTRFVIFDNGAGQPGSLQLRNTEGGALTLPQ